MKQIRINPSAVVGSTTESMMIRVVSARCTDPELSGGLVGPVVGEPSTGVAAGVAAFEVDAFLPMNNG